MSNLRDVPGIAYLVNKYSLKEFVETGCGQGHGLRYAMELGLDVRFSCDLNWESVALCNQWGTVSRESSVDFLERMIKRTWSPTLWFLDAHFPEVFGCKGEPWPLPKEVAVLAQKDTIARDVIIMDDMHCIHSDDNPTRDSDPAGHDWQGVGGTIAELTEPFAKTHTATLHKVSTGILVLEPK